MNPAKGRYVPQLDGVRAICIIFTVYHHMPARPTWINGTIGVDIFFALSRWLITSMLLAEAEKTGAIDVRGFYIRRIFRILPMYYVTLMLYILAAGVALKLRNDAADWGQLKIMLPWYATFNAEYRPLAAGDIAGHSWTLGVEEKFYLVWPLIFAWTRSRALTAFALSSAISLVLVALAGFDPGPIRGYLGLGFGAVLAIMVARWPTIIPILSRPIVSIAAVAGIACFHALTLAMPTPFWNIGISFSAAFLIANLWHSDQSLIARLLAWQPLAFVGRLTFGIYLLHVLVINAVVKIAMPKLHFAPGFLVSLILAYGASIIVAYVFYRLVEHPLIKLGRKLARG